MKTKTDHDTTEEVLPVDNSASGTAPTGPNENRQSVESEIRQDVNFAPLIYAYTRANAIADGVLVDVSELAREAGFRYPVAMTEAAWQTCVRVPDNVDCQDETGRLWDVLIVLRYSIVRDLSRGREIRFAVSVVQEDGISVDVSLKSICHPGDDAEPVITILLPHED